MLRAPQRRVGPSQMGPHCHSDRWSTYVSVIGPNASCHGTSGGGRLVPVGDCLGIEPAGDELKLHVKHLAPDGRAGASGLFGFHAPDSWQAVGLSVSGIAVPLDDSVSQLEGSNRSDLDGFAVDDFDCGVKDGKDDEGDGDECSYSLLVTREGEFASKLWHFGEEKLGCWPNADCHPDIPRGVSVDALHRVMGLPSPGAEPPTTHLVISLWLDEVMNSMWTTDRITWRDAVQLHLGHVGPTKVDPSVEMVARSNRASVNLGQLGETPGTWRNEVHLHGATTAARTRVDGLGNVRALGHVVHARPRSGRRHADRLRVRGCRNPNCESNQRNQRPLPRPVRSVLRDSERMKVAQIGPAA